MFFLDNITYESNMSQGKIPFPSFLFSSFFPSFILSFLSFPFSLSFSLSSHTPQYFFMNKERKKEKGEIFNQLKLIHSCALILYPASSNTNHTLFSSIYFKLKSSSLLLSQESPFTMYWEINLYFKFTMVYTYTPP